MLQKKYIIDKVKFDIVSVHSHKNSDKNNLKIKSLKNNLN